MNEIVALLRNRFCSNIVQASVSVDDDDKSLLLDLPEDVSCIIYEYLAPGYFLPAAPMLTTTASSTPASRSVTE